jgi:type I restriction enzyme S subunit
LDGRLKVTRVTEKDLPAILYQRVGRLKTVLPEVTAYVFQFMLSQSMLRQVESYLQGSDQPYINTSDIPKIYIPIPPLAEQSQLIRIAELATRNIANKVNLLDSSQLRLAELNQSILSKAFRGELVPQDPNDEPASELLARIRASREAEKPKRKRAARKKKAS